MVPNKVRLKDMRNLPCLLIVLLLLNGCASMKIDSAASRYRHAATDVRLGDTKESVLAKLEPTQSNLPQKARKTNDQFLQGEDLIEVFYFRSSRQADYLTTDDEFTPYIFKNGKLVGIGWAMLGGPKTQGQSRPTTVIHEDN